jgi:hypothetical protein
MRIAVVRGEFFHEFLFYQVGNFSRILTFACYTDDKRSKFSGSFSFSLLSEIMLRREIENVPARNWRAGKMKQPSS